MTDSDRRACDDGTGPVRTGPNGDHPRRIDRHIAYFGDRITTAARTRAAARQSRPERRPPPSRG